MNHVLEVSGLRKAFADRVILSDVYLRLQSGTVAGLIGRNGEGKSTLMKAVYGSVSSEASVCVDGVFLRTPYKSPQLLRYLPQFHFLPNGLRVARVLADYDLSFSGFAAWFPEHPGVQTERVGNLSGGWKRILETYVILCSESAFVMLDEPFTRISPVQVETLKRIIAAQRADKGILVTDHLVPDLLDVATETYMLRGGVLRKSPSSAG